MKRTTMLLGVLCLLAWQPLYASNLSSDVQATMITKILAYDQNIEKNVKSNVLTIGVLGGDNEGQAIVSELKKLKAKGVKIKNVNFDVAVVSTGESLSDQVRAKNVGVLYVANGKANIGSITGVTREMKLLSIAGDDAEQCVKDGIAIGLTVINNKPSILVNPEASVKEGRDFSAQFLTLTKIVK